MSEKKFRKAFAIWLKTKSDKVFEQEVYPELRAIIGRCINSSVDMYKMAYEKEDLMQHVLLRLLTKLDKVDLSAIASLKGYIFIMASNTVRIVLIKENRSKELSRKAGELVQSGKSRMHPA